MGIETVISIRTNPLQPTLSYHRAVKLREDILK